MWRKQCEELRNAHSEEIMGIRREEEMEMSDDDSDQGARKNTHLDDSVLAVQAYALREENDSLRWQLDAYRNEVELLKQEQGRACRPEENHVQEQPLHLLHQSLHSMQQQLQSLQEELRRKEQELEQAREESSSLEGELLALQEKGVNGYTAILPGDKERRGESAVRGPLQTEKEAMLLGIISTFLHVHPFGANIEYLWSYIQRLDAKVSAGELERLMVRLPRMFRQELSGVGATLEKRWRFCGFEGLQSA